MRVGKALRNSAVIAGVAGALMVATAQGAFAAGYHDHGRYPSFASCDNVGYYGERGGLWSNYFCYPWGDGSFELYVYN